MTINSSLLRSEYTVADMAYLDTDEAMPMYREMGRIVTDMGHYGIIDVGCRTGEIREHIEAFVPYYYTGFDTSEEPIRVAEERKYYFCLQDLYVASWDDPPTVAYNVDLLVFGAVLIYADKPWDMLDRLMDFYQCDAAIIQEPSPNNHEDFAYINMDTLPAKYMVKKSVYLDLQIPCGKRNIVYVNR